MKQYKLRKDTPTIKAGTIFEEVVSDFDGAKELARITPIGAKTNPQWTIQDIDNFDEWFEKIQDKVDSIYWRPNFGDVYFSAKSGYPVQRTWRNMLFDYNAYLTGDIYRTEKECELACIREQAKTTLRRTSTFKPDFENGNGGYVVFYSYNAGKLGVTEIKYTDYGEIVRYETKEDAEKSIKEHEKEWLTYFGVEDNQ